MLKALTCSEETPREGRFSFAFPLAALGAGALVLSWLLPNHYPPWTSFHNEAAAFAALVLLCLAFLARRPLLELPRALLIFVGVTAWIWLQWAAGQIMYLGDATVSSLYLVGLAFAWWLGHNATRDQRGFERALVAISALVVASAALSVFIGVLQWQRMENAWGVFAAERGPLMRPFGNLAQPNHLATFVLMAMVLANVLFSRGRLKLWQYIALLAWLSFGLVITESRAGLGSAAALAAFFFWRGRKDWGFGDWRAFAAWGAGLLLATSLWTPLNSALLLQPARDASLTQDNARMVMWKQSVSAIEQSPWFGYGWRQTVVGQKSGADFVSGNLATDYAHNVILDLLLWLGIPLGVLLVAVVGRWLLRAARRVDNPTQFVLFASAIPMLVHSLFEFPFAYSYFLFPIGWMLGALGALQAPAGQPVTSTRSGGARFLAAFSAVIVFGFVCSWVALEYFDAEEDYRVMRFELRQVGRTPADYKAPHLVVLTQLGETLKLGRLRPYPGMPAADIERLRIASASQAWATLQLSYAVALGLNGKPEEASHQLANIRALYGKEASASAEEIFLRLRTETYPQLRAVRMP